MARRTSTLSDRIHSAAMIAAAVITAAFWTDWYTKGTVKASDDPEYTTFEESFPLADAYMALCYVAAGRALWRGAAAAVPWGIAAGSANTFLGLMDLLFDLRRGSFAESTVDAQIEKAIVGASLVFGPLTMVRMWKARSRLVG